MSVVSFLATDTGRGFPEARKLISKELSDAQKSSHPDSHLVVVCLEADRVGCFSYQAQYRVEIRLFGHQRSVVLIRCSDSNHVGRS